MQWLQRCCHGVGKDAGVPDHHRCRIHADPDLTQEAAIAAIGAHFGLTLDPPPGSPRRKELTSIAACWERAVSTDGPNRARPCPRSVDYWTMRQLEQCQPPCLELGEDRKYCAWITICYLNSSGFAQVWDCRR